MQRNKFAYICVKGAIANLDWDELKVSMAQWEEGEIIVRKKISWDTDQMRKYFHGPARKFVQSQLREAGHVITLDQIKDDFKMMFGPKETVTHLDGTKTEAPKSTAAYTADDYKVLLRGMNDWCRSNLNCELPPKEQVE